MALAVRIAALLLVSMSAQAFLLPSSQPLPGRRRAAQPRADEQGPSEPLIKVDDKDDGSRAVAALGMPGAYQAKPARPVREPPPYPEGLHPAAKADREGPFWSSLGEPDVSTGVRPPYLRRDDWHISSTYTAAERAAVEEEERQYIESVTIEVPVRGEGDEFEEEEEEEEDPFQEREYMKLEPTEAPHVEPSKVPLPQTWQEYQFMQEQVARYAAAADVSPADKAEATEHEQALAGYYDDFKTILAEGWTLQANRITEGAAAFLIKMKKR